MLTLELEVPKNRASLAIATLRDDNKILMSDFAAASATPSISAEHGNPSCDPKLPWGHPPLGTYWLIGSARNTGAPQAEYGGDQFVFYSKTGSTPRDAREARKAGLHGRRGLLAYSGALGADSYMRRTQGGIRLPDKMVAAICKQLPLRPFVKLTLRQIKQRTWWAFWRPDVSTPPLSATEPQAIKVPDDEMTLLAKMLRRFILEPTRAGSTPNTRESQREDSSSSFSSDRTSSSSSDSFRGQGGQSGGGGASGSWGGADGNSRVAAGVAVGAAAALVAGAAMGSEAAYTTYASPFSDSSRGSDGGWTGGGSDSSSSNSWGSDSGGSDSGGSDSGGSDSGGSGGGD
jgi:hypothetical protein